MLANNILHTIGNTPHIRINRLFGAHAQRLHQERAREPRRLDQGPHRAVDDRGRRGQRRAQARRHDHRADLGQHRRRPGDGGGGQGLQADPRDARQHERRAPPPDAGLRRELRADAAREGHERRDRARQELLAADAGRAGCRSSSRTRPTSTCTCAPRRRRSRPTFPSGVDALITGVGTGGHITGCAQVLKAKWPKLKVFAVEPSASPVISGGKPSPHPIQGIGAGFIPKNLHTELLDGVIQVEAEAAREMARRCGARGRHAGRHLVGRDAGGDRAEAARAAGAAPRCSASTTTPASATSRSKASCRPSEGPRRRTLMRRPPSSTAA